MIKVKLNNGEIKEVTNNVAFDLIDRKLAKVYKGENKQLRPVQSKGYVVK